MPSITYVDCCICYNAVLCMSMEVGILENLEWSKHVPLYMSTTCPGCSNKVMKMSGCMVASNIVIGVMYAIRSPGYTRFVRKFGVTPKIASEYMHVISDLALIREMYTKGYLFYVLTEDVAIHAIKCETLNEAGFGDIAL